MWVERGRVAEGNEGVKRGRDGARERGEGGSEQRRDGAGEGREQRSY